MAKHKDTGKMHRIYFQALKQLGQKVTERQSTITFKKLWKKLRKDFQAKGETPPNLYTTAKEYRQQEFETTPRDEEMRTDPAPLDLDEQSAQKVIDDFMSDVTAIYNRTLSYIQENKENTGHEGGKLASIADYRRSEIDAQYYEIISLISQLRFSGVGDTTIAQAIKDNVELDYDIAIRLSPPSDIIIDFEETISQLLSIMSQIDKRAQELAEEAEREYYGQ